jgi:hypothetical protein
MFMFMVEIPALKIETKPFFEELHYATAQSTAVFEQK